MCCESTDQQREFGSPPQKLGLGYLAVVVALALVPGHNLVVAVLSRVPLVLVLTLALRLLLCRCSASG